MLRISEAVILWTTLTSYSFAASLCQIYENTNEQEVKVSHKMSAIEFQRSVCIALQVSLLFIIGVLLILEFGH